MEQGHATARREHERLEHLEFVEATWRRQWPEFIRCAFDEIEEFDGRCALLTLVEKLVLPKDVSAGEIWLARLIIRCRLFDLAELHPQLCSVWMGYHRPLAELVPDPHEWAPVRKWFYVALMLADQKLKSPAS